MGDRRPDMSCYDSHRARLRTPSLKHLKACFAALWATADCVAPVSGEDDLADTDFDTSDETDGEDERYGLESLTEPMHTRRLCKIRSTRFGIEIIHAPIPAIEFR